VRDLFRAFYQPLASSFLALLTFFSLSAALRAVRRRTPEALVIIIVALVVLIVSALPTLNLPLIGDSVQWISDYLVLAGARALIIGAAIGAVIAGVRVLLGFDQPFLDR
jgi:phosphotransferase system  glucose/maltose/N-acetylglucosamine-specific IIC component